MSMPSPSRARILVIEDDPSILLGLRINLESEGYEVATAADGAVGLEMAEGSSWDLIVLDLMLPHRNGYEIVCSLRAAHNRTPVLILSARSTEVDKIMGLDLGADDYITKPFAVGELLARVRAALRRKDEETTTSLRFADIHINPETREIRKGGQPVELTVTEFDVLSALVQAGGRVLSRNQIMDQVWGANHHGTQRTIDNFIAQLRAKLEDDPPRPRHILTVRGIGYRFAR
jgi:DNA-binding response OmpR family regulator